MVVVDLYDVGTSIIEDLHRKGKRVICYFSAGTKEDWRDDASKFPSDGLGVPNKDWDHETWVDIRNSHVRRIMRDRIVNAKSRHCDGVDPNNVDGYFQNQAGLHLTPDDQLDYNRYLATDGDVPFAPSYGVRCALVCCDDFDFNERNLCITVAHGNELAIGLKNDVNQLSDLVGDFDFAINDSCMDFDHECDNYKPFFDARKPVFHIQYVSSSNEGHQKQHEICSSSKRPHDMNTIIKHGLVNWKIGC